MKLEIEKLDNGDLKLSMDEKSREELKHERRFNNNYWSILSDLFEPYSTNGSYTIFDAGEANPYVGLTSAPCIAESMNCDDDGNNTIEGDLWWFPNYMIICEIDELIDNGNCVFTKA